MRACGNRKRNLQNSPTESPSGFFFFADSQKKIKKNAKKIAVLIFFPLSGSRLICSVKSSLKAAD
jgi:hypothetical protein